MSTRFQGTRKQRETLDVYIKLLRAGNAVRITATIQDMNRPSARPIMRTVTTGLKT